MANLSGISSCYGGPQKNTLVAAGLFTLDILPVASTAV